MAIPKELGLLVVPYGAGSKAGLPPTIPMVGAVPGVVPVASVTGPTKSDSVTTTPSAKAFGVVPAMAKISSVILMFCLPFGEGVPPVWTQTLDQTLPRGVAFSGGAWKRRYCWL